MVVKSLPNVDDEIGMPVSPFQYAVQDPLVAAWRNAMVRYLDPDCWASAAGLSPVHASKYGANTCVGRDAA
jgi:hypothetical protein